MVILLFINFYMDYCLIQHFVLSMFALSGWYDEEQNVQFSVFNWWFESVIWWSGGTRFVSIMMMLNSLLPFAGPFFNLIIVITMYFIIYQ